MLRDEARLRSGFELDDDSGGRRGCLLLALFAKGSPGFSRFGRESPQAPPTRWRGGEAEARKLRLWRDGVVPESGMWSM